MFFLDSLTPRNESNLWMASQFLLKLAVTEPSAPTARPPAYYIEAIITPSSDKNSNFKSRTAGVCQIRLLFLYRVRLCWV